MAGIYLHIPFCTSRCVYCDFYSTQYQDKKKDYVNALVRELRLRADYLRQGGERTTIQTIYLGGGTPSTLETSMLETIFNALYSTYDIAPQAEITLEANPDDLTPRKIHELHSLPVNRLSIGMQSASDAELACLGRVHRASDLPPAVALARKHGFTNINLDLMMGIPCQTLASFSDSLDAALSLAPAHLSVYSLQIEQGTPFFAQKDALPLPGGNPSP